MPRSLISLSESVLACSVLFLTLSLSVLLAGSLSGSADVAAQLRGQLELRFPDATARAMRSSGGASWTEVREKGLVLADKVSPVLDTEVRIVAVAVRQGRAVRRWVSAPITVKGGLITLSGDRFLPGDDFLPAEFLRGVYRAGGSPKSIAVPDAMRASDAGSVAPTQPFFDQQEVQSADGLLLIAFPDVCFARESNCEGALTQPLFAMPKTLGD